MRSVLITGSSRGIGARTARAFAEAGYRVFINYYNSADNAQKLLSELRKLTDADCFRADVSDSVQVSEMFRQIEKICGGIDVLVNNAGIAQTKLFTELSDQDWNRMIAVNLNSAFFCCRAALPYMIRQHSGRIINVSSMWGQVGGSCEVHYSAAKAGIIGLTKGLAMEEGPSGITVNCVAPGLISTDMTAGLSAQDINALCEDTPVGTAGTPDDIARTVLFLADEKASFITGQVIGVNGGFVM